MGVSLYLVFYNKLLRPTKKHRLLLLAFIFLAYLLIGAFIFSKLNLPIELKERNEVLELKKTFLNEHKCFNETDLDAFISLILNASDSGVLFVDKLNDDMISPNWIFGGETLFFTFTLLATIGYGHLAPLTQNGKLFCIGYVIVGVPFTILLLTVIVDKIEFGITKNLTQNAIYSKLDNKRYHYRSYSTINRNRVNRKVINGSSMNVRGGSIYWRTFCVGFFLIIFIYLIPSLIFTQMTELNWSILDSVYYTYISITTIGFGDLVPGEDHVKEYRNVYRLLITGL
jgi:potassium channel subfamily K protein 1